MEDSREGMSFSKKSFMYKSKNKSKLKEVIS